MTPQDQGKICVVIDLDETLVHSSFKVLQHSSFVVTHLRFWAHRQACFGGSDHVLFLCAL